MRWQSYSASLFTLWFAANMQVATVVTGALAVILGLPLGWALVAVVVGNALGGIFMALHSAQGPTMGIPLDQLALSPQCGFASEIGGNLLSEEDQWRKLDVMLEVAARVWG